MHGRKPIPLHLRELRGGKLPAKARSQPNWIERQKRRLRAPSNLSPSQMRIWRLLVKEAPARLLQPIDVVLLRRLVVHVDLAEQYEHKLRHSPPLIKTPNGMPQQSPFVGMLNRQTLIVQKLLAELSVTPSERARLGILSPGAEEFDDESEFFD